MKTFQSRTRGFTLIETMIAIFVLAFGLLSLAMVFTEGITFRSVAKYDLIAKEKAAQAVESIFTARDTGTLTWAQIQNVSGGGVFLDAARPLFHPGPDGLVNTADDDPTRPDTIVDPGPDGILGTADDVVVVLGNFTRQIVITPRSPTLRRIQVIVQYQAGRLPRTYTLNTLISQFN